jgi:hypothetical protein
MPRDSDVLKREAERTLRKLATACGIRLAWVGDGSLLPLHEKDISDTAARYWVLAVLLLFWLPPSAALPRFFTPELCVGKDGTRRELALLLLNDGQGADALATVAGARPDRPPRASAARAGRGRAARPHGASCRTAALA